PHCESPKKTSQKSCPHRSATTIASAASDGQVPLPLRYAFVLAHFGREATCKLTLIAGFELQQRLRRRGPEDRDEHPRAVLLGLAHESRIHGGSADVGIAVFGGFGVVCFTDGQPIGV